MYRIAYDIDGTLVYSIFQEVEPRIRSVPVLNPLIDPDRVKVIVSGRSETTREETLTLLNMLGIYPKTLILNGRDIFDLDYICAFKASALNRINAKIYVDDDPITHMMMRNKWTGKIIYSDMLKYVE